MKRSGALRNSVKAVVVTAVTVGLLSSQAAYADSSRNLSWNGYLRASGSFTSDGEVFRIKDQRADGMSVAIVYFGPTQDGVCENFGGAGTTKTCDLNFPENESIYYRVLLKDDGKLIAQSSNVYDRT